MNGTPRPLSAVTKLAWAHEHISYRLAPGTEEVLTDRETLLLVSGREQLAR